MSHHWPPAMWLTCILIVFTEPFQGTCCSCPKVDDLWRMPTLILPLWRMPTLTDSSTVDGCQHCLILPLLFAAPYLVDAWFPWLYTSCWCCSCPNRKSASVASCPCTIPYRDGSWIIVRSCFHSSRSIATQSHVMPLLVGSTRYQGSFSYQTSAEDLIWLMLDSRIYEACFMLADR